MPRGGARRGAGRPPSLSEIEVLVVGGECEARWNDELRNRTEEEVRKTLGPVYAALIDEQHAIPVADRATYLETLEADERAEEIEEARRHIADMADDDLDAAPRLISVAVPRPYGRREAIICDVAAWASERFGKSVSKRRTRDCWDFVRSVLRGREDDV